MFGKKKRRAWYWQVLGTLAALRVIYGFARFFLKAAEKMGRERRSDKVARKVTK